jgi:fructose-1,6-bisphosphatase/inositol monophosphatase family enzyme
MEPAEVDALVDYYLPFLVTAGDFARAIQGGIRSPKKKAGPNAWAQALTDADIAVQTFVEVATKARDPDLGFFGEESAQSANDKYFDPGAETVVHLDPVNGTFLYQHQRDGWDIILSISHRGRLQAAVSYMPARGLFYLAVRHRGALTGTRQGPALRSMQALRTQSGSRVCLTYHAPDMVHAVRDQYDAFDMVDDDDPHGTSDNLNDLFTGRLDAFACRGGQLLDWGAIAFIVCHAGGRASNLDGTPLTAFEDFAPQAPADMLVSASPAIHREILALVNGNGPLS